jgi:hypothetical protein
VDAGVDGTGVTGAAVCAIAGAAHPSMIASADVLIARLRADRS